MTDVKTSSERLSVSSKAAQPEFTSVLNSTPVFPLAPFRQNRERAGVKMKTRMEVAGQKIMLREVMHPAPLSRGAQSPPFLPSLAPQSAEGPQEK